ncbi:MAG: hypothetical protein GY870_17275 [archaeon]|nr:hypothetical protein [archaeon]
MAKKKKETCPHCGNKFVDLSRHKCKQAPKSSKKKKSTKKSSKKKGVQKKTSRKTKKSSKKTSKTKPKSIPESKAKSNSRRKSYSEIDKEVLSILKEDKTIFNDDLLKKLTHLNIDVKTLEKSIFRLVSKQKLKVKSDVKEGIRKDRVTFIEEYEIKNKTEIFEKNELNWQNMNDCPCFLCSDVSKCNEGQNETNPILCANLVDWINCCLEGNTYLNPFKELRAREEEARRAKENKKKSKIK